MRPETSFAGRCCGRASWTRGYPAQGTSRCEQKRSDDAAGGEQTIMAVSLVGGNMVVGLLGNPMQWPTVRLLPSMSRARLGRQPLRLNRL